MTTKKGYKAILLLTTFFTVTGVGLLVLMKTSSQLFRDLAPVELFIIAFLPFIFAGTTCVVRKRFFTSQD